MNDVLITSEDFATFVAAAGMLLAFAACVVLAFRPLREFLVARTLLPRRRRAATLLLSIIACIGFILLTAGVYKLMLTKSMMLGQ